MALLAKEMKHVSESTLTLCSKNSTFQNTIVFGASRILTAPNHVLSDKFIALF